LLFGVKACLLKSVERKKSRNTKVAYKLKELKVEVFVRNIAKPDLERQKEIANYLDSVYEKIKTLKEKIQSQITKLEEMKESILEEVFMLKN